VHHGNPEAVELTGRTHAGQHEQVWRADGPGTEDSLLALAHKRLAVALHFNTYGTLPTEQNATRHTVCLDGEIQTVPRQTQVAQRCAVPNAVGVIQQRQRPS
jgi:hypothetical protein